MTAIPSFSPSLLQQPLLEPEGLDLLASSAPMHFCKKKPDTQHQKFCFAFKEMPERDVGFSNISKSQESNSVHFSCHVLATMPGFK